MAKAVSELPLHCHIDQETKSSLTIGSHLSTTQQCIIRLHKIFTDLIMESIYYLKAFQLKINIEHVPY